MGLRRISWRCTASRRTRVIRSDAGRNLPATSGPIESYLSIDEVIRVAKLSRATPYTRAYGLLSESPEFAEACAANGITFIGPKPETMRQLGNKVAARNLAISIGVPVVPATELCRTIRKSQATGRGDRLSGHAQGVWGGGGRGMRRSATPRT